MPEGRTVGRATRHGMEVGEDRPRPSQVGAGWAPKRGLWLRGSYARLRESPAVSPVSDEVTVPIPVVEDARAEAPVPRAPAPDAERA